MGLVNKVSCVIPEDKPVYAWHLLSGDGRTHAYNDKQSRHRVTQGKTLHVDPPITLCENGLHWCEKAIHATEYSSKTLLCRVAVWGRTEKDDKKGCSQYRKCLWMANADVAFNRFCRYMAAQCLEFWHAPAGVEQYLREQTSVVPTFFDCNPAFLLQSVSYNSIVAAAENAAHFAIHGSVVWHTFINAGWATQNKGYDFVEEFENVCMSLKPSGALSEG